jgi:anti-sigma B factor antagonist
MNPRDSEHLQIQATNRDSGATVIALTGALTLRTLFEFQEAMRQYADKPMVIDISGVPYMDSAGLGSIMSVFASCQRNNRKFAITGLTDRIRTLFQVTKVDGLLSCFDSVELAEAFVTKP